MFIIAFNLLRISPPRGRRVTSAVWRCLQVCISDRPTRRVANAQTALSYAAVHVYYIKSY